MEGTVQLMDEGGNICMYLVSFAVWIRPLSLLFGLSVPICSESE